MFLESLKECETAESIQDVILTIFEEEASKAREFARKFLERRRKMMDVSNILYITVSEP